MKSAIFALLTLGASTVSAGFASAEFHKSKLDGMQHRRHHHAAAVVNKRSTSKYITRSAGLRKKKRQSCKASSSASSQSATAPVASSSASSSSSSSGSSGSHNYPGGALQVKQLVLGMVPDGGGDGGSKNSMAQLNSAAAVTFGTFGQYAQAQSGKPFDGSQLLQVMDDLKASGAIFEPAVMPTGGWQGLTASDNSQAVNICNVMKKFTDEGIEVRLRFAHEVNWYQTDGTYTGTAADFKAGWAAVSAACKEIAPAVKMFFTPNVAQLSVYEEYFPDDPSTVDIIGVDYYPSVSNTNSFLDAMKGFHDKYCAMGIQFAIGETGLGSAASAQQRMSWLQNIVDAKSSMDCFTSMSWFNFEKGYNFKIVDPNDSNMTDEFKSYVSSGGSKRY